MVAIKFTDTAGLVNCGTNGSIRVHHERAGKEDLSSESI